MTAEQQRLEQSRLRQVHWKRWGPYLSERQWGTVREDYSHDGEAWNYFPFEHSHLRAYRWGEDGIAGISDRRQFICFSLAMWNGRDPILKERLYGLGGKQGNHGEDVKECYFYVDSTPTHSYMKYLYKYPQQAFPYGRLAEEGWRRGKHDPELELWQTGIFDDGRYFDVFVEYAKEHQETILVRITAFNRGPEPAMLHLLPTVLFRNTWSWGDETEKPRLWRGQDLADASVVDIQHRHYGRRRLLCQGSPELLFTENETNRLALYAAPNRSPFVKDSIATYLLRGDPAAVNPRKRGTKAAALYARTIAPGESMQVHLRLTDQVSEESFGERHTQIFDLRRREADEFYERLIGHAERTADGAGVQRQAFAGLMWSKQFYFYDVARWIDGDPGGPPPPPHRGRDRNADWRHLYNDDIISMPDKWEYPWYAAWDLAFHCLPLAVIDPEFAKEQLVLLLREWYMHPNGQIPAYEWKFADVNPPVHAWAAFRVYKIEGRITGRHDRNFLERIFHKLLLNFTWWVNRKDPDGRNVFQGGFLGLDNIGVFDRSNIPPGLKLEQSDSTSWMAMYCLNMLAIALELAKENRAYSDVATKFFEHFVYIVDAMHGFGREKAELWDEEDGFYYDVLHRANGSLERLKVRSLVGLIPLFAVETLEPEVIETLPGFKRRLEWFIENRPWFRQHLTKTREPDGSIRRLLSIVNPERLPRVLRLMLDEEEFLAPYGIRSLSKFHQEYPYEVEIRNRGYRVEYEPAESRSYLFGGNSNWRGPIWFPVNYLLIESLQKFHFYLGDEWKVECPSGSGQMMNLWEVSVEISKRLNRLFLLDEDGKRPVYGGEKIFHEDPHWRDYVLFYEYFHGDNGAGLGASHQTGWTALVAKLLEQAGE
ncbi:MAG: glucosidase [Bryobacterales bacterium]|nr:glucosidase [Acidobacteriota bacterium]MCB9383816.1 glucosidase [Bryobacterales bacterium]